MNIHPAFLKLGKKPAKHVDGALRLSKYTAAMPPAPKTINWSKAVTQPCGMMGNDVLGLCTLRAGMAHFIQLVTANTGSEVTLSDAEVLAAYEQACGYNPADPSTDQGGVEVDVLQWWQNVGIGNNPHKILGRATVNVLNHEEVMQALWLFGGLYTGVALPVSGLNSSGRCGLWDVDGTSAGAPGSWGGHCVVASDGTLLGADGDNLTCMTWGALQKMTWAFWDRYFDEVHVVVTHDWITKTGQSPNGFDLATLQQDLAQLAA